MHDTTSPFWRFSEVAPAAGKLAANKDCDTPTAGMRKVKPTLKVVPTARDTRSMPVGAPEIPKQVEDTFLIVAARSAMKTGNSLVFATVFALSLNASCCSDESIVRLIIPIVLTPIL